MPPSGFARINLSSGPVDGQEVAFLVGHAVDCHGFGGVINLQLPLRRRRKLYPFGVATSAACELTPPLR